MNIHALSTRSTAASTLRPIEFSLALLTAAVLTACGGGGGASDSASAEASSAAAASTDTTSAAAEADSKDASALATSTWTKVADEFGSFTLSSARTVRFGSGSSWIQ